MAKIRTSIDTQSNLTIHTVSCELTLQEILDKLHSYYRGEITSLILWDLTSATWAGIPTDKFKRAVKSLKKYSRPGGKTAFVFSQAIDFGMGRMLSLLAELENYDFVIESFRNRSDAEDWLFYGIE